MVVVGLTAGVEVVSSVVVLGADMVLADSSTVVASVVALVG